MNIEEAKQRLKTDEDKIEGLCEDIIESRNQAIEVVLNELDKKDILIDLIVNRFQQICATPSLAKYQWKRICSEDLKICEGRLCEDCIKEYFTNKVEREGK